MLGRGSPAWRRRFTDTVEELPVALAGERQTACVGRLPTVEEYARLCGIPGYMPLLYGLTETPAGARRPDRRDRLHQRPVLATEGAGTG